MPEDAGALLVRSGLIAKEQLRLAREAQARHGGTVGEHLVLAGVIGDEALTEFYRTRLMVPQVQPEQLARIGESLIAKIPADMATEFRCIPVACDRDRNLTLAMADPSTTHTVDEISFFTGHYVVRAVATQRQIAWALAHYYSYLTPLGERLMTSSGRISLPGRSGLALPLPPEPAARAVSGAQEAADERARLARADTEPQDQAAGHPGPEAGYPADADGAVPVIIESDRPSPPPHVDYHQLPPEDDQRYVSFLREDTAPTGPIRTVRRPITQPPELAARAGEVEISTGPLNPVEESLPAVMISPTMEIATEPHALEHARRAPTTEELSPAGAPPLAPGESSAAWAAEWESEESWAQAVAETAAAIEAAAEAESAAESESESATAAESATESESATGAVPATATDSTTAAEPLPEPAVEGERPAGEQADGVVLLDRPKIDSVRRRHKRTRIGLGFSGARFHHEVSTEDREQPVREQPVIPTEMPDEPTRQMAAPVPFPESWSSEPVPADSIHTAALAAAEEYGHSHGATSGAVAQADVPQGEAVPDLIHDDSTGNRGAAGQRHAAQDRPEPLSYDDLSDEHWGPPGSTIPPELLGPPAEHETDPGRASIPLIADHLAEEFDDEDVSRILGTGFDASSGQVADYRASRLATTPHPEPGTAAQEHGRDADVSGPVPPERSGSTSDDIRIVESQPLRGRGAAGAAPARPAAARDDDTSDPKRSFHTSDPMDAVVLRELEESSLRLVEILRDLDQADTRNEVIDTLIAHLAESHERAAFFVVKSGELTTWKQRIGNQPIEKLDGVKLSLDEPSTFQDIVGTRLPFRGPLTDAVSRAFIAAALGPSAGEMLGLPVSVRGRVVGVLYGDRCKRQVFEQHLAVVTRAAGVALERILRAKKNG